MSTFIPEKAAVRKAIQWISQMRKEGGETSLLTLIDQACVRFNLSPKDCDFMHRFFTEQQASGTKKE